MLSVHFLANMGVHAHVLCCKLIGHTGVVQTYQADLWLDGCSTTACMAFKPMRCSCTQSSREIGALPCPDALKKAWPNRCFHFRCDVCFASRHWLVQLARCYSNSACLCYWQALQIPTNQWSVLTWKCKVTSCAACVICQTLNIARDCANPKPSYICLSTWLQPVSHLTINLDMYDIVNRSHTHTHKAQAGQPQNLFTPGQPGILLGLDCIDAKGCSLFFSFHKAQAAVTCGVYL